MNHLSARDSSRSTPLPSKYISPIAHWEGTNPCVAALWYHFAASPSSCSIPSPAKYDRPSVPW